MITVVMVLVAETEVTFDCQQDVVSSTAAVVTSSVDICKADIPCHKLGTPASAAESDYVNEDDCQSLAEWLVIVII